MSMHGVSSKLTCPIMKSYMHSFKFPPTQEYVTLTFNCIIILKTFTNVVQYLFISVYYAIFNYINKFKYWNALVIAPCFSLFVAIKMFLFIPISILYTVLLSMY